MKSEETIKQVLKDVLANPNLKITEDNYQFYFNSLLTILNEQFSLNSGSGFDQLSLDNYVREALDQKMKEQVNLGK